MIFILMIRNLLTAFTSFSCFCCYTECRPLNGTKGNGTTSTATKEDRNVVTKTPYSDNTSYFMVEKANITVVDPENVTLFRVGNEIAFELLDIVTKEEVYYKNDTDLIKETQRKWQLEDFVLIRIVPLTKEQLLFLQSLQRKGSNDWIQFWRHPDAINRHTDFWITPQDFNKYVLKLLPLLNIHYKLIKKDFTGHENPFLMTMKNIENYDKAYHNLDELYSEMVRLVSVYDDILSAEVIGKSFEKRPIHVLHLRLDMTKSKPIIFLLCGTHAREWLAVSSCQYTLRRLVFDHKYDDDIKVLLEHYDVAMVPMLNPDAYKYTLERRRMWRKSRSTVEGTSCRGVDLNRNFNFRWGTGGTSQDPCKDIFCGHRPFSESESLALGKYLYHIRRKVVAFLDVHTFGQMWMSPWGYTRHYPNDYKRQESVMKKIHKAIKKETGEHYRYGRSFTTLYQTSGTAMDWVYGLFNIVHTYGIELRPNSGARYSQFERPPKDIIPSGKDLYTGLITLAKHMIEEKKSQTVTKEFHFVDGMLTPPKQSYE